MIEQFLIWEAVQLTLAAMIHAMHDPLHIFRAAEILREAIIFAGFAALISSIISSLAVIVVTSKFTHYLRQLDAKKLGLALFCLVPLGLSGCWGGDDEDDCYWWHRHRHPHHWRAEDKSDTALLGPVKRTAMPSVEQPATPRVARELKAGEAASVLGVPQDFIDGMRAERVKPGPFGGITAMKELQDLKRLVTELANRPVVCRCECGRRQRGPSIYWRVDPLNPSVIQYGYEVGGFFYVLSSSPRPVGFEPPK